MVAGAEELGAGPDPPADAAARTAARAAAAARPRARDQAQADRLRARAGPSGAPPAPAAASWAGSPRAARRPGRGSSPPWLSRSSGEVIGHLGRPAHLARTAAAFPGHAAGIGAVIDRADLAADRLAAPVRWTASRHLRTASQPSSTNSPWNNTELPSDLGSVRGVSPDHEGGLGSPHGVLLSGSIRPRRFAEGLGRSPCHPFHSTRRVTTSPRQILANTTHEPAIAARTYIATAAVIPGLPGIHGNIFLFSRNL